MLTESNTHTEEQIKESKAEEVITVQTIKDNSDSVYDNIRFAEEYYLPYPDKPTKPILKPSHSADELFKYATDFEVYQKEHDEFELLFEVYAERKRIMDEIVEDYIKDEIGLSRIPKLYRDKVWNYAFEKGKNEGYYGVFQVLNSLMIIFGK